jgi:hypothetical protein
MGPEVKITECKDIILLGLFKKNLIICIPENLICRLLAQVDAKKRTKCTKNYYRYSICREVKARGIKFISD